MDRHDWLEAVTTQLQISGASPAYRRRLHEELRDHIEDLTCEERNQAMSAQAVGDESIEIRLGTPQEVAAAAKAAVPRGRFARRHPVITFLLLPIPALVALWVIYALGLIGMLQLFQQYRDVDWAVRLAGILIHSVAYVPAVILVLGITWISLRSQTRRRWWLAATILVALVSTLMIVNFQAPTTPGTGVFAVGLGAPPDLTRIPQFLVPLVMALLALGLARIRGGWHNQPISA